MLEGFLDAMALFLTPPDVGSVVGCCLDLPIASRSAYPADQSTSKHTAPGNTAPAISTKSINTSTGEGYPDQGPPTVTLRIARTGHYTATQDQQQKDFARKIIKFLRRGRRVRAQPRLKKNSNYRIGNPDLGPRFAKQLLRRCRGKIMNCILGNDPGNSRISQFLSIIQQLADGPPPAYIRELENLPYAENSDIYTPQSADNAFQSLMNTLRIIAKKTKAVGEGRWSGVTRIVSTALGMRFDIVFMAMLEQSLPARDAHKAKRFLGRLAAYEIAMRALRVVFRKCRTSSPHTLFTLFTGEIAISLLPPNHMSFQPPTLDELSSSVMTVDDHRSLQIPPIVCQSYTDISTDVDLAEHCEIQLVRFYIENPDTAPVLPYLGVSKLSCFQCSSFLRSLQDPGLSGALVKFGARGGNGRICGRWLPPDSTRATGAVRDRMLESLQYVADEIRTRLHQRFETTRMQG